MEKLSVELETVTPLFLAGADPRGPAELRAPSFRGALRYWLRAIAGHQYRDIESYVFGDTTRAGCVSTRVSGTNESNVFKKKGSVGPGVPSGYDYLYWSMGIGDDPPHQYMPLGSKFVLSLACQQDKKALSQACATLWLLVQLGGLGSRSRRTGGSLRVSQVLASSISLTEIHLSLGVQSLNAAQLAQELSQGIATARDLLGNTGVTPVTNSDFDIIAKGACRIWVLSGNWKTGDIAIEAIGSAMRDFRSRREPDHRNVAPWIQGGKPAGMTTVERAVFGLPLPFRYSHGGPTGVVQGRKNIIDRRASPLWLHVTRLSNGQHVGVATLFKSRFLPSGEHLHAMASSIAPPPDYSLIERFVTQGFTCHEVVL